MDRQKLQKYLENFLNISNIQDYCPNGLQIEGKRKINSIMTGVTANLKIIEKAVEHKIDALIVHHGLFWKNESSVIVNLKYKRIKKIIENKINLFAYHIPLDIHPVLGNNIQLAKLLNLKFISTFNTGTPLNYGILCTNNCSRNELINLISAKLKRIPLVVEANNKLAKKIAICTGAGQNFIEYAASAGADIYISGEISEKTTHLARELDITYISAGHHATERYGVKSLGNHLKNMFNVSHQFIEIDNPA